MNELGKTACVTCNPEWGSARQIAGGALTVPTAGN